MTLRSRSVCLYVDGAQNPLQLERGIGRLVSEHARALYAVAPSLIHSVLLNPRLSLTGNVTAFLGKGLLSWSTESRAWAPATQAPGVYHIMSPFEATTPLDVMWPHWARDPRIATVVTLYDLIPLVFPDHYLHDPGMRAFYNTRLDLIRHADGILAISHYTAKDAIELLQVSPDRVHVIHAGASEHFARMYSSSTVASAYLSRHLKAVRPGFLLYVGAADFRKNPSKLIAGFARLPAALRAQHQLVIAGFLNPGQAEMLQDEATLAGIGPDEIVFTGHVTESVLGALYHACTLFVFPSFYEGFGLPIVEAMSCGAPVAASGATSLPEVLGDLEGTFEPHDGDSIAACLFGILTSPELLDRLKARSRRRAAEYTWKRVAEHSIEAYEDVVTRTARRRSRRPRIALVTPWPPERSPIAVHNYKLASALAQHVDVDVIVGRPVDLYPQPQTRGVRLMEARDFEHASDLHQHDRVLYCMGNSQFHRHVYELLTRRPGAVVLHDVALAPFYRWYAQIACSEDPDGTFADWIHTMYGDRLPPVGAQRGMLGRDREAALGIYMTRELQSYAECCYVHSRFALEVLALDRGPSEFQAQVSILPFPLPDAAQVPRGAAGSSPLIVSLGPMDEARNIATLIEAFAMLALEMPTARLVVADRTVDETEVDRWREYASREGPGANMDFAGERTVDWYGELLRTADLAVQLQLMSGGEHAAAIAECLASGLPTIVTDLGWASDLPHNTAEKVPPHVAADDLRDHMARLLVDTGRRAALSGCALEHARGCSVTRVADAYLGALGLS
jgi:glycosyltransferase involved in cell wall biosynthesis